MNSNTRRRSAQSRPNSVSISVAFSTSRLTPRGVRRRFLKALHTAIARNYFAGTIDEAVCEELWRALPSPEGV